MTKLADTIFTPDYVLTDAKLARRARIWLAISMAGFAAMVTLLIFTVRTHHHAEHSSSPASARITLPPLTIAPEVSGP